MAQISNNVDAVMQRAEVYKDLYVELAQWRTAKHDDIGTFPHWKLLM